MRILPAALAVALPSLLCAQIPNEAALRGDPKTVMLAAADRALEIKPRNARVLAETGAAHLLAGQREKAEALFASAADRAGDDAEVYRIIAGAWVRIGARDRVPALAGTALQRAPRGKNELARFAADLMDGGFPTEAETLFTAAFELGPSDWQNVSAYGRACLRAKRQDLAAKWWAKGMAKSQDEPQFWNEIALALTDGGAER